MLSISSFAIQFLGCSWNGSIFKRHICGIIWQSKRPSPPSDTTLHSKSVPGLKWINVGDLAKEKGFLGDWDETYECHELEEDPLLDELESPIALGGALIDHHVTDFFPERFFDIGMAVGRDFADSFGPG